MVCVPRSLICYSDTVMSVWSDASSCHRVTLWRAALYVMWHVRHTTFSTLWHAAAATLWYIADYCLHWLAPVTSVSLTAVYRLYAHVHRLYSAYLLKARSHTVRTTSYDVVRCRPSTDDNGRRRCNWTRCLVDAVHIEYIVRCRNVTVVEVQLGSIRTTFWRTTSSSVGRQRTAEMCVDQWDRWLIAWIFIIHP